MSYKTSFTIDELQVTTDNQSNPIWYISDYNTGSIQLHPEQGFVANQIYLAKALDWLFDDKEIHVEHADEPVVIPIRKAMCTRCRGKGTMANPAFDGTSIEWWQEHGGPDWQDDLDEYCHGDLYDVPCEYNCSGGIAWTMDWQRIIHYHDLYKINAMTDRVKTKEEDEANEWINELYIEIQDWHDGEAEVRAEQAYFDREWAI
jgi:hypothetical protein|tara:strand:- start:1880 stop:2488 length:609 start_codon:yes stop_codon:yes gene_type:complete